MNIVTYIEATEAETRRKASEDAQTRAAQDALLLDSHQTAMHFGSRLVMSWEESPLTHQ